MRLMNRKFFGKLILNPCSKVCRLGLFAYLIYLCIGQFHHWMAFVALIFSSVLGIHVVRVVGMSSRKKMPRVTTTWVVAFVAYQQLLWKVDSMMELIRNSMCGRLKVMASGCIDIKASIPFWRFSADPGPTRIRFFPLNFLPKAVTDSLAEWHNLYYTAERLYSL